MIKYLVYISIFYCAISSTFGQSYVQVSVDIKDEMRTDWVKSIAQDQDGFIWIGSYDGLYRFDGHRSTEITSSQLSNRRFGQVHNLEYFAKKHSLYIGTSRGVFEYDIASDSLHSIAHLINRKLELDRGKEQLFITAKDRVRPVLRYDIKTESLDTISDVSTRIKFRVSFDKEDDLLWLGGYELIRHNLVNAEKKTFSLQELEGNTIEDIYSTSDYVVLLSDDNRVLFFNKQNLKVDRYFDYNESDVFTSILKVENGNVLLTATDNTLVILDRKSGTFQTNDIEQDESNKVNIEGGYYDKDGRLWVFGNGGLAMLLPKSNRRLIEYFDLEKKNRYKACVYEDSLLFQMGEKLEVFNIHSLEKAQLHPAVSDLDGIIVREVGGRLLGYRDRTIYEWDSESRNFTVLISKAQLKNEGLDSRLVDLTSIGDTLAVVGFNKVLLYDRKLIFIREETIKGDGLILELISNYGRVIASTQDAIFERKGLNDYEVISALEADFIDRDRPFEMLIPSPDTLLLCTNTKGIGVYTFEDKSTGLFDSNKGWKSNIIPKATVDAYGNIWGVSSSGLCLYNRHFETFVTLDSEVGLLKDNLIFDGVYAYDSTLFVSHNDGIGKININDLQLEETLPPVNIYQVNDESTSQHQFSHEVVHYDIRFSTFDHDIADHLQYEYRINKGSWIKTSQSGKLQLSALQPGAYQLQIKGTDHLGRVTTPGGYSFTILSPWYQTWWFYLLCGFSLILLGYYIYHLIDSRKKQKVAIEEKYFTLTQELENQVLRAQMNPHFLFNSLNSIRYFIVNKETDLAANYLTKFSRLIRMILEFSNQNVITLAEEIDMVKHYVFLEKIRFEHKFTFTLEVDKGLNLQQIQIPPMVIQPFLENAILHGINPKEDKATLSLKVLKQDDHLRIEIADDGIGRAASASQKSHQLDKKKSMGMGITQRRLHNFASAEIEVSDLYPGEKDSGTLVVILVGRDNSN